MALGCSHQGLTPETQDDEARVPRPPPRPASEGGRRQGARAQESGSSGTVLSCRFLPSRWSQSHSSPRRAAPAGRIKLPLSLTTEPTHGQPSPERPGESQQGGMAQTSLLADTGTRRDFGAHRKFRSRWCPLQECESLDDEYGCLVFNKPFEELREL